MLDYPFLVRWSQIIVSGLLLSLATSFIDQLCILLPVLWYVTRCGSTTQFTQVLDHAGFAFNFISFDHFYWSWRLWVVNNEGGLPIISFWFAVISTVLSSLRNDGTSSPTSVGDCHLWVRLMLEKPTYNFTSSGNIVRLSRQTRRIWKFNHSEGIKDPVQRYLQWAFFIRSC